MNEHLNIKKNIMYNTIGNTVYLGCQWLITILVVRLSGYTEAGILALAMTFSNILYSFSSYGMRGYQVSDVNNKYKEESYYYSRVFTCLLGLLVFTVFILLNNYDVFTKACIIVYFIYRTIEAFVDVLHARFQKEWRMDVIGISFILRGITLTIFFAIGLIFFHNLLISFLLIALSSALVTLFYDLRKYQIYKNKDLAINKKEIISLLVICLPLVLYVFLFNNIQTYPRYFLQQATSSDVLGIYSSITSPILILQALSSFVFYPFINIFADLYAKRDRKNFNKLIIKILMMIVGLGIVGLIFIILFGEFALQLLFGKDILEYSYLLYSGLLVVILLTIISFFNSVITVTRKFISLVFINGMGIILSIIFSKMLIGAYGIDGVNYALSLTLIFEIVAILTFIFDYDREVIDVKKIKDWILKFSSKHMSFIGKYVPSSIIYFVEKLVVSNKGDGFVRTEVVDPKYKTGINVIGYIKGQFGLAQSARLMCKSIEQGKYDLSIIDTKLNSDLKYNDNEYADKISNEFKYNINLWCIQPYTNFEIAIAQLGEENLKGRYNVGFWLYELEDIPKKWASTFNYVNEIWTPSEFVSDAFRKIAPVPVHTIPYGIEVTPNPKLTREDFNIPKDKFAYLLLYDPKSSAERKNPNAAIDAYIKAFGNNDDDVCLVIKLNGADQVHVDELKEKLKDIKNYVFINEVLPKDDVYSLISLCDVFVSLHRSEGFGFVLAEAMALGTVCIATNYSANLDFMNKENSCLVDYKMVPVSLQDNHIFEAGNMWADADIDDASRYMKLLYNDKELYNKLAKNAKKHIEENFSTKKSTEKIEKRIDEIKKENNLK